MITEKKVSVWLIGLFLLAWLIPMGCRPFQEKRTSYLQVLTEETSLIHIPQYVALAKGFFQQQDLKVELYPLTDSQDPLKSFVPSKPQVLLACPSLLLTKDKAGSKKPLVFAQTAEDTGYYLMAREQKSDFNWLDLKGNSIIGGPEEWLPQMTLEYLVKKNGLRPQWDLTIYKNIPSAMAPGAFQSGVGAYLLVSDPIATTLQSQGIGQLSTPLAMGRWELPAGTYLAWPELLVKDPIAIQKFTNGIYLAQQWMAKHTVKEIVEAAQPYYPKIKKDILEQIVHRYKKEGVWTSTPSPSKKSFELLQEIVIASGQTGNNSTYESLTETKFATEAIRSIHLKEEEDKDK